MNVNDLRLLEGVRDGSTPLEERLILTARALVERGLVVGSVGNVSVRVAAGFLVTPTRMPYPQMRPEHLVYLELDGTETGSPMTPSREWPLHSAIYRMRPDVAAIVHTHSVHATAWSFLDEPLGSRLEESSYYDVGPLLTSAPAPAGSQELGAAAVRALGDSRAALLGRHGVVATGSTLDEALTVAEVVEREAHVAWLLRGA